MIKWLKRYWACRTAGPHCCDGWPNDMIECPGERTTPAGSTTPFKWSISPKMLAKESWDIKDQRILTGKDIEASFKQGFTLVVPVHDMTGKKIKIHKRRSKHAKRNR